MNNLDKIILTLVAFAIILVSFIFWDGEERRKSTSENLSTPKSVDTKKANKQLVKQRHLELPPIPNYDNFFENMEVSAGQKSQKLKAKGNTFYVKIVSLEEETIDLYFQDRQGKSLRNLKKLRNEVENQGQELSFATNGGIFRPDYTPEGLFVQQGKTLFPLNLNKGYGNFYMPPNGVFFISKHNECGILASKDYPHLAYLMKDAIQSGPLLVHLGKINAQFMPNSQSKFIRSGVGIIDKKTLVFILSEKPVNFYEFARLFKENFHCQEALYLDGAISEFYLPQLNQYFTKNSFAVMIGITAPNPKGE